MLESARKKLKKKSKISKQKIVEQYMNNDVETLGEAILELDEELEKSEKYCVGSNVNSLKSKNTDSDK